MHQILLILFFIAAFIIFLIGGGGGGLRPAPSGPQSFSPKHHGGRPEPGRREGGSLANLSLSVLFLINLVFYMGAFHLRYFSWR